MICYRVDIGHGACHSIMVLHGIVVYKVLNQLVVRIHFCVLIVKAILLQDLVQLHRSSLEIIFVTLIISIHGL